MQLSAETTVFLRQACHVCGGKGHGNVRHWCRQCRMPIPDEWFAQWKQDGDIALPCGHQSWERDIYSAELIDNIREEDYCDECDGSGIETAYVTLRELAAALDALRGEG